MISAPPIGPLQGKRWGTTRCVYVHNNSEIWEIDIRKGGYCSEHYHHNKWNRFVVFSGKLKVMIFLDDGLEELIPDARRLRDETILSAGDCTDIPPGVWHVFEALEDVKGIEVYWTSLDSSDITRRTTGGMKNGQDG